MEYDVELDSRLVNRTRVYKPASGSIRIIRTPLRTEVICSRHGDGYGMVLKIDRHTSAMAVLDQITAWLRSHPIEPPPPELPGIVTKPNRRSRKEPAGES